jgi:hypothetical protein
MTRYSAQARRVAALDEYPTIRPKVDGRTETRFSVLMLLQVNRNS